MANKRQKKKKSAQAARQAAAAYKGKNAPIQAKAPVKPQPVEKTEPMAVPVEEPEIKQSVPQTAEPVSAPAAPKAEIKQPEPEKKAEVCAEEASAKAETVPEKPVAQKKRKKQEHSEKRKLPVPKKPTVKKTKGKLSLKKALRQLEPVTVRRISIYVLEACAVLALVSIVIWAATNSFTVPDEAVQDYMGRNYLNSQVLTVEDDLATQYEFADEIKRRGDKDAFRYYAATSLVFPEKNSKASLNLVNVYDNTCILLASIVDEAGNVVFNTSGLVPGKCLSEITLDGISYGTHEMKLVVSGYNPETYELVGVQYSDLTVQIGIEEEVTDAQESEN